MRFRTVHGKQVFIKPESIIMAVVEPHAMSLTYGENTVVIVVDNKSHTFLKATNFLVVSDEVFEELVLIVEESL